MDELSACTGCHIAVRPTDYFCFNCGKNLHAAPPGTKLVDQMKLYVGSILLAPMGIFWGLRYLREENQKLKIVGIIAIALSVIIFIVAVKFTVNTVTTLNTQVEKQLQGIEGF